MVQPKQPASAKQPQTPPEREPKTLNTTPSLNPHVDFVNRTLP